MQVSLHGFDWAVYTERIMPAFASWLVDEDETAIYELYKETQCAREEQFVPVVVKALRSWPRAQALTRHLPRGPQARREYQRLCAAEQFLPLSDRYVYRHPPQIYQTTDALRTVWGAVLEEYCMLWMHVPDEDEVQQEVVPDTETTAGELTSLLHSAGLDELAQEVNQQALGSTAPDDSDTAIQDLFAEDEDEEENAVDSRPQGIVIGRHPTTLHLRGWLASISVRGMALFELLACGRRTMPFGYEAGTPFGAYIGYLTPTEVWQLALCLRDLPIPQQPEGEEDYRRFRVQQAQRSKEFRMIDEVRPAYAQALVKAVRNAAMQGLGLLCSVG